MGEDNRTGGEMTVPRFSRQEKPGAVVREHGERVKLAAESAKEPAWFQRRLLRPFCGQPPRQTAGHGRCAGCMLAVSLIVFPAFAPSAAQAGPAYAFDDAGYLGEATLLPDWSDTLARQQRQAPALEACLAHEERCPRYYRGLRHLLLKAGELPAAKQIRLINHYVNRKRYLRDRSREVTTPLSPEPVRYRSHWVTVEEFMRRGGDCEDFATTKYFLLRRLGFTAHQLRVVVTWDRSVGGYHAVLAVRHQGRVLLLESDNTIRRGSRHRYRFIYSVNEHAIWDHEATSASATRNTHQQREETAA